MVKTYGTLKIGNPMDTATLVGPLHTKNAVKQYVDGLKTIEK